MEGIAMYCGRCGKKIADDALFCPGCGADLSAMRAGSAGAGARGSATPGTTPAPGTTRVAQASATPDPAETRADGRLAEQISRTRRRSRRRIPTVLIVILVILAVAGTALAATIVYRTFIAPPQQEQPADEQAAPAEGEPEEDAEQNEADEGRAQRAVYDDVLTQYRDAQAQGWSGATGSDLPDLAALGTMASVPQETWMGEYYYADLGTTLSYAYTDLGGDGTLDLVVAARSDAGGYVVLGMFSTDGTQVTSLTNGDINSRSYWHVLNDGRVLNEGSDGAASNSRLAYRVEGGALVPDESATTNEDGTINAWSADPDKDVSNGQAIWQELSGYAEQGFDWQPLEDFSPEAE